MVYRNFLPKLVGTFIPDIHDVDTSAEIIFLPGKLLIEIQQEL